ncbi:MAG: hypothetical protein ACQCN6_03615 [Candidatus Bathyarchaeia archaeon]
MRFPRGKWIAAAIIYLSWQVAFAIAISPLGFGVLTAEQMGFTLNTLWMGLLVAAVVLTLTTLLARTNLAYGLYVKGLSYIKTREEFDKFWTTSLRGCDDGLIAETHWSGVVLPLFLLGFIALGIPFIAAAGLAIVARWATHVGAHALFPKEKNGARMFGGLNFIAKGLAYEDTVASISFLISGNIIAPILLHHLGAYISTFAGNKERIAKQLGL